MKVITKTTAGSLNLGTILFVVFLALKLTGTIAWSWWWVTSPLWIPMALLTIALLVVLVIAGLMILFGG